jgi:hypothetical protein
MADRRYTCGARLPNLHSRLRLTNYSFRRVLKSTAVSRASKKSSLAGWSARCVTSVFDAAADLHAAVQAEGHQSYVVAAEGRFRAELTRVSLGCLDLSALSESLPRISFIEVPRDRILAAFALDGRTRQVWEGRAIEIQAQMDSLAERCIERRENPDTALTAATEAGGRADVELSSFPLPCGGGFPAPLPAPAPNAKPSALIVTLP